MTALAALDALRAGDPAGALGLLGSADSDDAARAEARGMVVVEAMRPGALAKLGLGYEDLKKVNPKIVFATLSGYGATGPYKDMPSHGIAYDTWAGIVQPVVDDEGFAHIPPDMPNVGTW